MNHRPARYIVCEECKGTGCDPTGRNDDGRCPECNGLGTVRELD